MNRVTHSMCDVWKMYVQIPKDISKYFVSYAQRTRKI